MIDKKFFETIHNEYMENNKGSMTKHEKIQKLVNHWVSNMDIDDLENFYIDVMHDRLEDWDEKDLDYHLGEL